jgi:hypothetical protein
VFKEVQERLAKEEEDRKAEVIFLSPLPSPYLRSLFVSTPLPLTPIRSRFLPLLVPFVGAKTSWSPPLIISEFVLDHGLSLVFSLPLCSFAIFYEEAREALLFQEYISKLKSGMEVRAPIT